MLKGIYPGSFDPVTRGHVDIIERAAKVVDRLVVSVIENPNKKALFTVEERMEHLRLITRDIPNVEVASFQGLTVDFAAQVGARAIIRGLRYVSDFEPEFQMALVNKSLNPEIETLFISADPTRLLLSSSAVKEVATFGGDFAFMVPEEMVEVIADKFKK